MATSRRCGRAGHRVEQRARRVGRHAELVDLQAGRDVRVALGVDVRIDADGDAGDQAARRGNRFDALELARGFDVDRPQAERHRRARARCIDLPTPVNTMSSAAKPARRATSISQIELASTALPRPRSSCTSAERGVGLERVVQAVRVAAEGLVERRVAGTDRRRAVDVERRAFGRARSPTAAHRRRRARRARRRVKKPGGVMGGREARAAVDSRLYHLLSS